MDCGREAAPVWRLRVQAGESVTVPLSEKSPLRFVMKDGSYRQRRLAEKYLQVVSFWAAMPRVLGVNRSIAEDTEESVLVVRVATDGTSQWSDSANAVEISRALARVLPEYREGGVSDAAASTPQARRDTDWLGIGLLSGGGLAILGGSVFAILTERRARQVRCSTGSSADCEGVERLSLDSPSDVAEAESEINLARAGYISAIAVGAGLAGWGAWRMLTETTSERQRVEVQVGPARNGFQGSMLIRF